MAITIGTITFQDFEIPSAIRFGGTQRTVVHRLGDGRRVVDRLGRDETDISFSGVISGSDATVRVRALDLLRSGGQVVSLRWDTFEFDVIVRQFIVDFQTSQWIPYQLSCAVLDRPAGGSTFDLSADVSRIATDMDGLIELDPAWEVRLGMHVRSLGGVSIRRTDTARVQKLIGVVRDLASQTEQEVQALERAVVPVGADDDGNRLAAANEHLAGRIARAVLGLAYLNRIEAALTTR